MKTSLAYGVDLAGYSSKGKSQVAKVVRVEDEVSCHLEAEIIPTALLEEHKGYEPLAKVVEKDVRVFSNLVFNCGICAVDVPIDLQGLNEFGGQNKKYVWEATKRPIDYILGALPPLADRIGAVVARMQLIMKYFPNELGRSIFETYPAGTLAVLGIKQQYKGGAAYWKDDRWVPSSDKSQGLSNLLHELNIIGLEEGQVITDDQFDAIISAVPLLCQPWLTGPALMQHPFFGNRNPTCLPEGFILCGEKFWSRIEINPKVSF